MVESQSRGNVRQGDDPGPDAPKRSAPKTPPTAHTDPERLNRPQSVARAPLWSAIEVEITQRARQHRRRRTSCRADQSRTPLSLHVLCWTN
jgi:hypothetical protein